MFEIIRQDLSRARRANQAGAQDQFALLRELANPATQAILIHRFGYWADHLPFAPLRFVLRAVHFLLQCVISWRVGVYIPVKAEIGPGLVVHTWGGGVFLPCCKIGRNLTIVGGGVLFDYLTLQIGDDVTIGAGTKSMGRIRIGNRVHTGPNAVVQDDVPDDCLVFGNPGRVVRQFAAFRRRAGGDKATQPVAVASEAAPSGARSAALASGYASGAVAAS